MKMEMKIITIILVVKSKVQTSLSQSEECDVDNNSFQDGNIGESASFKWLGVLRVHLHEQKTSAVKIGLTGIVLVKDKYAIANAEDIVSIPRHIFREDSKAMFIPEKDNPWYCKPKSYMAHPEYEYSTYITIALIELDITEDMTSPLKSICLPNYSFNTSTHLYALGYTDENQLLEKVIYKLQYVNRSLCDEFYNRAEIKITKLSVPVYYECGYAVNNKEHCVWDNGMVFASNSTGRWNLAERTWLGQQVFYNTEEANLKAIRLSDVLVMQRIFAYFQTFAFAIGIGFGIRGPGCAGPARFIDMYHYLPWIESSTSLTEVPDYGYVG